MKHVNEISLYKVTAPTPVTTPMLAPSWTPALKTANQAPLTSTRVRVSPSPRRGKKSSPLISVFTTSTPIQPLQGNKQKYVIVQGNSRHLRAFQAIIIVFLHQQWKRVISLFTYKVKKVTLNNFLSVYPLFSSQCWNWYSEFALLKGPCLSKFLNHAD